MTLSADNNTTVHSKLKQALNLLAGLSKHVFVTGAGGFLGLSLIHI